MEADLRLVIIVYGLLLLGFGCQGTPVHPVGPNRGHGTSAKIHPDLLHHGELARFRGVERLSRARRNLLPSLIAGLRSADKDVAWDAGLVIGRRRLTSAVPALLESLRLDEARFRRLTNLQPVLVCGLCADNGPEACTACQADSPCGDDLYWEIPPEYASLLDKETSNDVVLWALGRMGEHSALAVPYLLPRLEFAWRVQGKAGSRSPAQIAPALLASKRGRTVMLEWFQSSDVEKQKMALTVLHHLRDSDESIVRGLLAEMNRNDSELKFKVIAALAAILKSCRASDPEARQSHCDLIVEEFRRRVELGTNANGPQFDQTAAVGIADLVQDDLLVLPARLVTAWRGALDGKQACSFAFHIIDGLGAQSPARISSLIRHRKPCVRKAATSSYERLTLRIRTPENSPELALLVGELKETCRLGNPQRPLKGLSYSLDTTNPIFRELASIAKVVHKEVALPVMQELLHDKSPLCQWAAATVTKNAGADGQQIAQLLSYDNAVVRDEALSQLISYPIVYPLDEQERRRIANTAALGLLKNYSSSKWESDYVVFCKSYVSAGSRFCSPKKGRSLANTNKELRRYVRRLRGEPIQAGTETGLQHGWSFPIP